MYATIQVGNLVKKKRSKSSFEKLSKYLSLKDILRGLLLRLVQMVFFRFIIVEVKEWNLEIDDSEILNESEILTPDKVEKCKKTGQLITKSSKWTEKEDMEEKYEELWTKHGFGIDAIEERYFNDKRRNKIICFDFELIKVDFNFNQSEKFYMLV